MPSLKLSRTISTLDEVKQWMYDLSADGFTVDPETSGKNVVVHETGERTFTDAEAAEYDRIWEEAYAVCDAEGLDICGVALDIIHETYGETL